MAVETDLQGRIASVSEAFAKGRGVSGRELAGEAYEALRHPEMPVSIYAQLWRKLQRGDEVFAYVQTSARGGGCRWELAHFVPRLDAGGAVKGYLAVHRRADAEAVAQIEPFYRKIRALEKDADDAAARRESDNAVAIAA